MNLRGRAEAFGAISVVNAIGFGKGAALGIGLKTVADVDLGEHIDSLKVEILGEPEEDTSLAKFVVQEVVQHLGRSRLGGVVKISSDIPIGRGLKSSSVASNAIALATLSALGGELDDYSIVGLGVEASLKAGVTVTGAYDDACASYFGGIVVTDNLAKKVLKMSKVEDDLNVLIYVPEERMYTKNVDVERLRSFRTLSEEAFRLALHGEYWKALTFNGLICSAALNISPKPIGEAIFLGALAAGVSGKGPAIAAVCRFDKVERIKSAWSQLDGRLIQTKVNNEKARVLPY